MVFLFIIALSVTVNAQEVTTDPSNPNEKDILLDENAKILAKDLGISINRDSVKDLTEFSINQTLQVLDNKTKELQKFQSDIDKVEYFLSSPRVPEDPIEIESTFKSIKSELENKIKEIEQFIKENPDDLPEADKNFKFFDEGSFEFIETYRNLTYSLEFDPYDDLIQSVYDPDSISRISWIPKYKVLSYNKKYFNFPNIKQYYDSSEFKYKLDRKQAIDLKQKLEEVTQNLNEDSMINQFKQQFDWMNSVKTAAKLQKEKILKDLNAVRDLKLFYQPISRTSGNFYDVIFKETVFYPIVTVLLFLGSVIVIFSLLMYFSQSDDDSNRIEMLRIIIQNNIVNEMLALVLIVSTVLTLALKGALKPEVITLLGTLAGLIMGRRGTQLPTLAPRQTRDPLPSTNSNSTHPNPLASTQIDSQKLVEEIQTDVDTVNPNIQSPTKLEENDGKPIP